MPHTAALVWRTRNVLSERLWGIRFKGRLIGVSDRDIALGAIR
jgi:hypothetical protein